MLSDIALSFKPQLRQDSVLAQALRCELIEETAGVDGVVYPCRFGTGLQTPTANGNTVPVSGREVQLRRARHNRRSPIILERPPSWCFGETGTRALELLGKDTACSWQNWCNK